MLIQLNGENDMIETIKNLLDFDINITDGYAYLVYGDSAAAWIKKFIQNELSPQCMVLKASGMLDSITNVSKYSGETVYCEKGDASKFFIKKYPEILMLLSTNGALSQVVDDWVCTCYERRILYFVNMQNVQKLIKLLETCKYDTRVCYEKVWQLVDCVIENCPESPDHDTFIVTSKQRIKMMQ